MLFLSMTQHHVHGINKEMSLASLKLAVRSVSRQTHDSAPTYDVIDTGEKAPVLASLQWNVD